MAEENFGRYKIRGQLGRGGLAIVYYAYDPRFQREVVIKVLPRELMAEEKFRSRFMHEAQVSATLNNPAFVPVYDVGEERGQPFLVMRYMSGGSLDDRIRKGPLSLAETARIVGYIAPALDEAHAKGIVHRDIKPSNILFDHQDNVFISDLGIVSLQEIASNITGSGPVSSPLYMAPELSMPSGLSPLVDVYALGVMLYQMLTGSLPYDAPTPMGVIMAHATEPIPDVREKRPDLPEAVQRVIAGALAKEPYQRYRTVGAVLADLQAAAGGRPLSDVGAAATMIEGAYPSGGEGATLLDQTPLGQADGATMIDQAPVPLGTMPSSAPTRPAAVVSAGAAEPTRPAAVVPPGVAEPTQPARRAARPEKRQRRKRPALDTALGVIVLLIVVLLATAGLILTGTLDPLLENGLGFGGGSPTAVPATQEEVTEEPVVVEQEATETPTEEPEPTGEEPTPTPRPTSSPEPSATEEPTDASAPSAPTVVPTAVPLPTATPEPLDCPPGSVPGNGVCLVSFQSNADSFENACARCPDICAGGDTVYVSCSPGIELSDGNFSAFCNCAVP